MLFKSLYIKLRVILKNEWFKMFVLFFIIPISVLSIYMEICLLLGLKSNRYMPTFSYILLFIVLIMELIKHRWSPKMMGIMHDNLIYSMVFGMGLSICICIILYYPFHKGLRLDPEYIRILLYQIGIVGFIEELWFRGMLLTCLINIYPKYKAVIINSLLFGLMHIMGGIGAILSAFFIGVLLCLIRIRTKNLIGCILAHGFINFFGIIFI